MVSATGKDNEEYPALLQLTVLLRLRYRGRLDIFVVLVLVEEVLLPGTPRVLVLLSAPDPVHLPHTHLHHR